MLLLLLCMRCITRTRVLLYDSSSRLLSCFLLTRSTATANCDSTSSSRRCPPFLLPLFTAEVDIYPPYMSVERERDDPTQQASEETQRAATSCVLLLHYNSENGRSLREQGRWVGMCGCFCFVFVFWSYLFGCFG